MKVLVECYHDVALVRALGVSLRSLGHEMCKGNVLRMLSRWNGGAIGVVDSDTGKPHSNPNEMARYRQCEDVNGLRLLRHQDQPKKCLIVIDPRLEEWLFARAQSCGIRPVAYGLPGTAREMHRSARCDRKPGFQRFLSDLLVVDGGMKTLKTWLVG